MPGAGLRENHSGMETHISWNPTWPFAKRCVRLNFDSNESEKSQTRGKMKRKIDVPPQWSIMQSL